MLVKTQHKGFRRRALSMTPLIDVIFLLLLFFMLSSTFSKFAEIELLGAGAGITALSSQAPNKPPKFLRLTQDQINLNGTPHGMDDLIAALKSATSETANQTLLVSVADSVTSQRLVDLLAVLGRADGLTVQVLGGK